MTRALILDLDNTIADTSIASSARSARNWKGAIGLLPRTSVYPAVADVTNALRRKGIKVGVVTNSVSFYAAKVLAHHNIMVDKLIAYHDTKLHKPHPAPVLACLNALGAVASQSLGVGDEQRDAEAYRAAGLACWGAGWSSTFETGAWDKVAMKAEEVLLFFDA